LIRNGRFPIEISSASGFDDDSRPPDHLPNDTYSTAEKPLTVITGINGTYVECGKNSNEKLDLTVA
jgi:hypothetical protein